MVFPTMPVPKTPIFIFQLFIIWLENKSDSKIALSAKRKDETEMELL